MRPASQTLVCIQDKNTSDDTSRSTFCVVSCPDIWAWDYTFCVATKVLEMQVAEHNTSSFHRDRSACICMNKVSRTASRSPSTFICIKKVPGTNSGEKGEVQYQNAWLKFYCCPKAEKKFPFRNRQVLRFVIAQLWDKDTPGHLWLSSFSSFPSLPSLCFPHRCANVPQM